MSTPHEPLTPEERDLAAQLSRLGPHGGPSPALDARILSAARTSVQGAPTRARPRWPLGLGVAASVLLAAGVAWQLRPLDEVQVASEVPDMTVSAPVVQSAPDPADAGPAARLLEPAQEPPRQAEQAVAAPEMPKSAPDPARRNAEAAARTETAPPRSPLSVIPSIPGVPVADDAPAPASAPVLRRGPAAPRALPAPAAPEAVADSAAPAMQASKADARIDVQRQRALDERQRQQARRAAEARDAQLRAQEISVAGARAYSSERDAEASNGFVGDPALVAPPSPPAPPPPSPASASAREVEPSVARSALRRTDLQVPVDADARLLPAEWLDRIRLRRDLGDAANATRSLQLFVQEHPFQDVPDDLRPLLGEP